MGLNLELEGATRRERPLLFQRLVLVLLQMAVGGGLAAGAYVLLRGREQAAFETEFSDVARHVLDSTADRLVDRLSAAATLALFASQSASFNDPAYPNVTLAGFTQLGEAVMELFTARVICFIPLVQAATRGAWEAYASGVLGAAASPVGIFSINATGGRVRSPDSLPLMPLWQSAPPTASNLAALMLNLASVPVELAAMQAAAATGLPVPCDTLVLVQDRGLPVPRPSSIVFAPVMRSGAAVGFASLVFSWDTALVNSLPNFVAGIDAVLKSGVSGATYSFRINGDEVVNTGAFDAHETDSALVALSKHAVLSGGSAQNWTLTLYPTAEMRASHLTRTPGAACAVVAVIVFVSSAVFWAYDWWASGRASRLKGAFMLTRQVVEDVFPERVRSRVLHRALLDLKRGSSGTPPHPPALTEDSTDAEAGSRAGSAGANSLALSMTPAPPSRWHACFRKSAELVQTVSMRGARADEPIADTFEACSVLFSDLVNFTAWSASVPPARVFVVLEAIFTAFDQLAGELGIFKIETVADGYVCCCGCPVPRADHAERMAAFALLMIPALHRAAASVGVTGMQMRIGFHSGAVTAGVLRTEKGRFQVFGDAMNTASRMESTGQPGRVQVSEAAAALLRDVPGIVLEPRGLVPVKGKGEMQTYWLVAGPARTSEDNPTV